MASQSSEAWHEVDINIVENTVYQRRVLAPGAVRINYVGVPEPVEADAMQPTFTPESEWHNRPA